MTAGEAPRPAAPARSRPRPGPAARARRILCSTVLVCEALVVVFALLVAKDLTDVPDRTLLVVGGGAALACLLLAGALRSRWAYAAGSILQVLLILSGFVVPTMFLLGAVFAGLWFLSLYLAVRIGRAQAHFTPDGGSPASGQ